MNRRAIAAALATLALGGGILTGDLLTTGGGGVDPPAGGGGSYPNASNTGYTGSLTAYTGPNPITTNGTTISGKLITEGLVINASGVTITNSRITINPATDFVDFICEDGQTCGETTASPLTITDSTLDCTNNGATSAGAGTAVTEANIVLRRVDIYGCENGMSISGDIDIQDSWIHDLWEDPTVGVDGTHTDGIQFSGSHYTGIPNTGNTPGIRNVTIQHNTIEGWGVRSDGSNPALTTSAIITNRGPTNIDQNILINNNLLSGGGNAVYCEQDGYAAVNERVTNNRFSEIHGDFDTPGAPNRSTDCSDESDISGNVDDATGSPVSLP